MTKTLDLIVENVRSRNKVYHVAVPWVYDPDTPEDLCHAISGLFIIMQGMGERKIKNIIASLRSF